MITPVYYETQDETNYYNIIERKTNRGVLNIATISDLHFTIMDPKKQYELLRDQFLLKIDNLPLDIVSINGDIFERKYMSNTDSIYYAVKFISDLVLICKRSNISLIIIKGTDEHEAGQLKLFYHYLNDPDIDIRIVETIKFEYIKGSKILCIPELYGVDEDIYQHYLFDSGMYDLCFMHGTIKGLGFGNMGQRRLFDMNDFSLCKGPIISGHIHNSGCYNKHFYYNGSPIRYKFGEDNPKGFYILLYDMDSSKYYIHLEPIESFNYSTISLDDICNKDPKEIIDFINRVKEERDIDYIRIDFNRNIPIDNLEILKAYYKNNNHVKINTNDIKKIEEQKRIENNDLYDKYDYLFSKMNEFDILAKFINDDMGHIYIEGKEIKELVEGK